MFRTRTARAAVTLALSLFVLQAPFATLAQGPAAPPAVQTRQPPPLANPAATVQQAPPSQAEDKRLEKIRRIVRKVGVGGKITLFLANGDELHGAVSRIGADDVDLAETDLRQLFTIRYANVRKVRDGYDHVSLLTGRRASSPRGFKIALHVGVIALIALPIIAIGAAKD